MPPRESSPVSAPPAPPNPLGRLGVIPTFAAPPALDDPDPAPPAPPGEPTQEPRTTGPRLLQRLKDRPSGPPTDTPTATSSAGSGSDNAVQKPTARDTALAVAGIIGIVAGGAALLVRLRAGRELRRPTTGQLNDIAGPLARILMRHADAAWLNVDLLDTLAAGNAIGAYVNDGPLTTAGPRVDPGVPANLQEDQP